MQHTTQGYSKLFQRSSLIIGAILVSLGLALCCLVPSAHAVTAAEKQAEAEEALANLTAMQESLDRLSAEYGEAVMAQEKAEKKRDKAEARIGEISKELTEVQGRLNERARETYRSGGVTFLEMVLGARTFEEFATSLDMANRVNQSDAQMVETQKNLKTEAEEQAVILDEQAEIAAKKSDEAKEAARQAEATVAEMQATYDSLSAEAAALLEEERKAREAEEAARAAAVLAAAQAQAEAEEAERAAQAADEESSQDSDEEDEDEDEADDEGENENDEGADENDGDDEDEENSDESASENENEDEEDDSNESNGNDEPKEQKTEEPAYEGGSDTVSRAYACIGAPYVWGGVGPGGYDCSGLVSYCLSGSHIRLGTTYTFMGWPRVANPQPGDIAVNSGHTSVYIGNGQMIHAATYGVGVIIGPVQSGMIFVRYSG
ncbi:MAG: C40 family peptidase [Eggerthellaceae bacterium]|nr:C40 family peptidase [Eggerthellaceae bacterium]